MKSELSEMLRLEMEPVGIFFANTSISCEHSPSTETRNCVVPLLMACAAGKIICLDEENCNCPGGYTGCCFGDGFSRLNPQIHYMLAQGLGDSAPEGAPEAMVYGERFFCDEKLAMKWRESLPYSQRALPRIVFAPESRWDETGEPDLVLVFADADRISAIVTMLGSHNGEAVNTIVPYGAACHSILFAAWQLDREKPKAVMGLFDISQRRTALRDLLTMTMPYPMWHEMGEDLEISALTTGAWHEIEKRLSGKSTE